MENQEIQVYTEKAEVAPMTIEQLKGQVNLVQGVMRQVMKDGEHFGVIPGCGSKPSLLKPGAEKLSFTFRMAPTYDIKQTDHPNEHREYQVVCSLNHIISGQFLGQGLGVCSTLEGKFRFRTGEVEFTGKLVPKEFWDDRDKKLIGGHGFSTKKNDSGKWEIVRAGERVEHDNPPDYYNTCLKMAKKRAHVDAVLTATAASDIFTQDIEEMQEVIPGAKEKAEAKPEEPVKQTPEPAKTPPKEESNPTDEGEPVITPGQVKLLYARAASNNIDVESLSYILKKEFDIDSIKETPRSMKDEILQRLSAGNVPMEQKESPDGEDIPF